MSDISNIKNIHKITINEDNGMLSPTTEDLTGGKLNRYQIAYGTARGARINPGSIPATVIIITPLLSLK